ncbi:MAG TPA: tRNA (uridine(54)-C5)-methyltransferase TrmA [Rhodocyclaceae bacterium]|nr:tRNA (uridine(54)-C5)-methyltransferase TrmA [Rhodocyclaceae bacterium]HNB63990.1 tRNA (uridine(54)-C5)-methyltransferase TrmA [Rhodocyclaceae bacterium]HNC79234.1 tRNA (uridine(54)-C5)-methyltransferase TrmA [Rhodocyclaceae bacterium]HNI82871.1 tRNA (uridine(54)-C5)-methyltransferase TrmA [Rhodocyclaceae bacterium]
MPLPRFDPADYDAQLAAKVARLRADFAPFGLPEPAVFRSEPLHYRLRAEFRLWHREGRVDYAMFDPENPRQPVILDDFPAAAEPIHAAMPRLRALLCASEVLRKRIFQVEFLATLSGELMISLVYHRPLDEAWTTAARALAAELGAQIIGRSRGQKIVLERDWLLEDFEVDGLRRRYQQIEGSFTQPNGGVNRQMLAWARARVAGVGGDLLELYCGNGNFTLALAPCFERVLATELSKSSVHAARYNIALNDVANVTLVRMSSDEISDALAGGRAYTRLRDVDLAGYRFSTLFVDPPRSGLDPATVALARGFGRILYISCNPQTLRDNVAALSATHAIEAAAAFDQFPYTHHLECGVMLRRRAD